ncbi:MAG: NFACT RNA binding domain-containing protein [Candidatus Woesearchaeota archaeon]
MEVDINPKLSVEENAALYYEKAKKAKKKLKGAQLAIEKFTPQLNAIEKPEEKSHVHVPQRKRFWFEKFRWFFTSSGLLVIGGRDAMTNEIVIKKHTEPHDLVFHTDMAGSPFFVLKTQGTEPSETDIQEVADATCTFSRAWKNELSTTSVFYVKPDQVTKEANSGEYLTKGAFVIRGKTNYVTNSVSCAVGLLNDVLEKGIYKGVLMCGSLQAVKNNCTDVIELIQGDEKPSDIAKKIKRTFSYNDLDEIVRVLPPGNLAIPKERKSRKR